VLAAVRRDCYPTEAQVAYGLKDCYEAQHQISGIRTQRGRVQGGCVGVADSAARSCFCGLVPLFVILLVAAGKGRDAVLA
jgi:hypothetical protein